MMREWNSNGEEAPGWHWSVWGYVPDKRELGARVRMGHGIECYEGYVPQLAWWCHLEIGWWWWKWSLSVAHDVRPLTEDSGKFWGGTNPLTGKE